MRSSFLRLIMFRRYNNGRQHLLSSKSSNNNIVIEDSSSILSLLAIQQSIIINSYMNSNSNVLNEYYNKSWNGTLGPSTCSYLKMSCKGERTLSRSRLEVCPANASSIAANDKPECPSLAFAKEPTPFVTDEVFKQIPFSYLFGYQLQIDGFAFHQFDDL
jgi:hypothetical protein